MPHELLAGHLHLLQLTQTTNNNTKEITMQNKYDDQILDNLAELNDTEIEELIGGCRGNGFGRIYTITCECRANSWQGVFTCCS